MSNEDQIGYIVNTQTYVLASNADDAVDRVKKGEGSVMARSSNPRPEPQPTTEVTPKGARTVPIKR